MAQKKKETASKQKSPARGKRYAAARAMVEGEKSYPLDEAIKLVKSGAKTKFDETVDIALNLGIDPRQSDQLVRGVVAMPNGLGKKVRVAVFAKGSKAEDAKKAGADIIGAEDLVEEIKKGKTDFDVCIAAPDMMGLVGGVARILGPKGLMPNPKLGTVTDKLAAAIKNAKSGQVEFRAEKAGIIHVGIGKTSFTEKALKENIVAFMDAVKQSKPSSVKSHYLKKLTLSSTMGPGVKVDITTIAA